MERRLYEAALSGDVLTLNILIQEDELILNRLSLTCLTETPLHISSLMGHLDFAKALLRRKPTLATELDSLGHSPLHLASAEGHPQIVSELLKVNSNVCNFRDQDGRIPLHLAAMRGRIEVIQELIRARPESVLEKLDPQGNSVLHLCVMYTHLEALEFFLKSVKDENFVYTTDHNGNTILHLAVALKHTKTLKYIISSGIVGKLASTKNVNGFTALDVLEQCPRDLQCMEIQEFLLRAGVQRGRELGKDFGSNKTKPSRTVKARASSSTNKNHPEKPSAKARTMLSTVWNNYIKADSKWVEEARGSLITTAALTATVAFQTGTNPPGGVWQDYNTDHDNKTIHHEAGTSILASKYGSNYCKGLLTYNTVSLLASMSIIILMISGFPLKNRVSLGFLTIAMCTALGCMALTYLYSLPMLTPDSLSPELLDSDNKPLNERETQKLWDSLYGIYFSSFYIWIAVCGVVLLLQAARFFALLKEKLPKFVQKWWWPWPPRSNNQNRVIGL